MNGLPSVSIALANFDRHVPFFMNWLPPADGFALRALDVGIRPPGRDGGDRHRRMLVDGEFDVAELSLASYIMALAADKHVATKRAPRLTAVPVFPRRLFSQNHIYVRRGADIHTPAALQGKRVALRSFQTSLSVLAKGDLKSYYGVAWEDIQWFVEEDEMVRWDGAAANVQRLPPGDRAADWLIAGKVDAFIDPKPPLSILKGEGGVRNLFIDQRDACREYFANRRVFPAMHVLAIKTDAVDRHPSLPYYLIEAWEDAKSKTQRAYEDFAYTSMPFGGLDYQESQSRFGADLWPSGLQANRENLEWFVDYLVDQTLLKEKLVVDELFHPSVRAT